MTLSAAVFLGLCLVGALVVAACRVVSRHRLTGGREPLELDEIFRRERLEEQGIGYETFRRVFEALGRSFDLDPRLIRPGDSFRDIRALDSWALGVGQERMEHWMSSTFELRESAVAIVTVVALLRLAEDSPRKGH